MTHKNEKLLDILEMNGHDVKQFYDLVEFNPYAVEFRYDPLNDLEGLLDREEIIERIKTLFHYVEKQISELKRSSTDSTEKTES